MKLSGLMFLQKFHNPSLKSSKWLHFLFYVMRRLNILY